jgi:hypothetical protein
MHFAVCNAILVEGKVLISRVVDDNKLLLGIDTSYIRLIEERAVHLLQLQEAEQLNVPSDIHLVHG